MAFGALPTRTRGQIEPMLSRIENWAMQNGGAYLLGYLQLLNSNLNRLPNGMRLETQEAGGKFQYWRLLYRKTDPITTFTPDADQNALDVCTRPTALNPDWQEIAIYPDGATKVQRSIRVDPTWINDIREGNFNSEMDFALQTILEQARNELNMKLMARTIQATGPVYVGPSAVSGPIYGAAAAAIDMKLPAMGDSGQINLAWIQTMREMLNRNGMGRALMVHGYGTMYNLVEAINQGIYGLNTNGIALDRVAQMYQQLGFFGAIDTTAEEIASYGTAPNNVGLGRDEILAWQPGAIHPMYYNHFKGAGKEIQQYDANGTPIHVKTTLRDPLVGPGFEWDFFINYEKCQANGQGGQGEYWMGVQVLADQWHKPTNLNREPLNGTNQILRLKIEACQPKDCAGAGVDGIFTA